MSLKGKMIIVTRPAGQEESFVSKLEEAGAEVLSCPLISIVPSYSASELLKAISSLESYDWIIFTSANGVHLTLKFAEEKQLLNRFQQRKIACIGKMTEAALSQWKLSAAMVPESFRAEGLIEAFKKEGIKGKRFLLLRAKKAREVLHQALSDFGGQVTELAIYDTIQNSDGMSRLKTALQEKTIDCISFTSPSTVHSFVELIGKGDLKLGSVPNFFLASIGPITSDALREEGLPVTIEAKTYTSEGLFEAINEYFGKKVVA